MIQFLASDICLVRVGLVLGVIVDCFAILLQIPESLLISISSNLEMMSFNFDFVTHNQPSHNKNSARINTKQIHNIVNSLQLVVPYHQFTLLKKAFSRIRAYPLKRVKVFQVVQGLALRRLQSALLEIIHKAILRKRGGLLDNQQVKFLISILTRFISSYNLSSKAAAFTLLKRHTINSQHIQSHLDNILRVCGQFVKRNVSRKFIRTLVANRVKTSQYVERLRGLEYLFETIRVKKLFEAFTCMSIKTTVKNLGELEKQKSSKKDQVRSSFMKRSQILNELKKKVTNVIGQVNEAQINNNRRKVNGGRQNGMKLTKINEEIRILEIASEDLSYRVANYDKESSRKQQYLKSRSSCELPFAVLKDLYHYIFSLEIDSVEADKIIKKVTTGADLSLLKNSLNFLVMDNAKLKFMVNQYEKINNLKKTDSYVSLEVENSSLKNLISSLIKSQLMSENVTEIEALAKEIKETVSEFRSHRKELKQN